MAEMNKKDFINLLKKLTEAQYDCDLAIDDSDDLDCFITEAKEITPDFFSLAGTVDRKTFKNRSLSFKGRDLPEAIFTPTGPMDLTNSTYIEIKTAIKRTNRIRIGRFSVHLNSVGANVNIQIFEDKDRYFGGHRKVIPEKVNMKKDTRFNTQEWMTYFKNPLVGGSNIPPDIAADIVKWVQVVYKYPAFL